MTNITWANQVLVTPQDIEDYLGFVNVPLRFSPNEDKNAALQLIIKTLIKLSKTEIFNKLCKDFKTRIPETLNNWFATKRYGIDNQRQTIERDLSQISSIAGLPIGTSLTQGAIFDLLFFLFSSGVSLHPSFFSNYGNPISGVGGSAAGAAQLGDFMFDTQFFFTYINTSSNVNSPTWVKFFATSALDNLLNAGYDSFGNPGIFMTTARAKVIELMYRRGSNTDRVGLDNNPYWNNMANQWEAKFEKEYKENFPNLNINLDQSGTMSDYDLSLMTPNYDGFFIL